MMRVYFTNLWLPCRQFPNNRQSGNLTRLGNLQSPVEGLAISCSYSAHAPLSVTQEHFLVTTRTQNGPHQQVCRSQVPVTRYPFMWISSFRLSGFPGALQLRSLN